MRGWISWGLFSSLAAGVLLCRPLTAETFHWTGAVDTNWFEAGNWTPAGLPAADDIVRIDAGDGVWLDAATPPLAELVLGPGRTLTVSGWDSALRAADLVVSGTVTHVAQQVTATNSLGEWVPEHRVLIQGSNLTIAATGSIDTDARGYPASGAGPGYGPGGGGYTPTSHDYGGGASYGGLGGHAYYTGFCGLPYGTPEDPWQPGSSGGNFAGAGGGAVRIELDGHLQVDGEMTANAATGVSGNYGGSSGGGIYLACRTVSGSGQVQARGARGNSNGGSGAGGRIALHFNAAAQDAPGGSLPLLDVTGTTGAKWFHSKSMQDYAMGSVYLSDAAFFRHGWPRWHGWLHLPTNRLEVAGDLTLADCDAALATVRTLSVGGDLTLAEGGTLYLASAPSAAPEVPGARLDVAGHFVVASGGAFHPWSHPTNGASVRVCASNVTVDAGGIVDASGRGFRGGSDRVADDPDGADGEGYGPGAGMAGRNSSGTLYGGGGSYGGLGGDGYLGWRGERYGEPGEVVQPGSGGAGQVSGYGGGLVWIETPGHAQIDGQVLADGDAFAYAYGYAGGGSGGGISIRCRTLGGSGRFSADGGNGQGNGGRGGGGRIALHYDVDEQAGMDPVAFVYELRGGSSGLIRRSAPEDLRLGSLFLSDPLLLGNAWPDWYGWLYLPTNRLEVAGDLTIGGSWAGLAQPNRLEVSGDLTIAPGGRFAMRPRPTTALWRPGATLEVGGELVVHDDGILYVHSHPTNGAPLKISSAKVTVEEGGQICGDERGYFGREDPWPAYGPGAGIQGTSTTHGSGAGYGGVGGYGYSFHPGGPCYGLALAPLEPGSGGGGYHYGGHGGATVWIETPGPLRVDGEIRSNGGTARHSYNGSGSGGGILLDAGRIVGGTNGLIRAEGADGNVYGGGGGGGRIACWQSLPPALKQRLISGTLTNLVADIRPASYLGATCVLGGFGYTNYGGELDIQQAGDGTVSWVAIRGTLLMMR